MKNRLSSKSQEKKEQKREARYGMWLFRKKGTAADPWPTAEDLWEKPSIQKAIQDHNKLVKK